MYHVVSSTNSVLQNASELFMVFFDVFAISACVLFSILGRLVSLNYRSVTNRALRFCDAKVSEANNATTQLNGWRANHVLVTRFAVELNDCFAYVLLVVVSDIFASVLLNSFYILAGFKDGQWEMLATSVVFLISYICDLTLMGYVSDAIHLEVSNAQFNTIVDDDQSIEI